MGKYKYKLKETNITGGSATFTPGEGEQITPKKAYNKNKKAKGSATKYYYRLGYKAVPDKIKDSGLEVKQLWEEEPGDTPESFQEKRIEAFGTIEQRLNSIYSKLSNAKNKTSAFYNDKPTSYAIIYPTDLILEYLNDIETLLNQ